ncbi:MAG TPA: hypothetical protein V6C89_09620 [Drouetiella sp.]|jgi:hypothetical protein
MQTKLNSFVASSLALALTVFGASGAKAASNSNQHFRAQGIASLLSKAQNSRSSSSALHQTLVGGSSFVQPYLCIDNATTGGGTTASFTNVANRFPLFANLDGPLDEVGLVVNIPAGTPAHTVSFEVVPTATTSNLFIAIGGTYVTPSGTTGIFLSNNQPNIIAGNQAKGKNLQYTFDLNNLINAVGDVPIPAGSTLTFLLIDAEELFPSLQPGSVFIDNVLVNGVPVPNKNVTPYPGCPLPL